MIKIVNVCQQKANQSNIILFYNEAGLEKQVHTKSVTNSLTSSL